MNISERYSVFGFWCSFGLHLAAVLYMLFGMPTNNQINSEIFTVDIESGNTLGGISQTPPDNSKVLPVAGNQQEETKVEEKPVEDEKVKEDIPEVEEDPDALRLDKQEVRKPTPTPTATPTPKPTPKPSPVAAASPKAVAKPSPSAAASIAPKRQTAQDIDNAYQQAMQKALGESVNAGGTGVGSTGRGGTGFGGGTQMDPERLAYMRRLTAYIKKGWNWHDPTAKITGSVAFNLAPDGRISNIRISVSSGDSAFDNSIMRAVSRANPAPPPPAHIYEFFKSDIVNFKPGG